MIALGDLQIDPLIRYMTEPPGLGGMSPPQSKFHQDPARKRLFRAGNQIGKTRSGAAEAWFHALGDHPYRDTPPPGNTGWVLASDLKSGWPSISKKMREIEPLGAVSPATSYDDARGYYYRGIRAIQLNNGSIIVGKGSDQNTLALASGTVDWQWVDELPKASHWSEFRSRGAVRNAPIWVTLTPIGRPAEWLRTLVDGDVHTKGEPQEPDWSSHVVPLTVENAPHRTVQDIEDQIASIPSWERSIRIKAGWESVTVARRVPGFTDANIFVQGEAHPLDKLTSIGIGADWGETVGNTIFVLVGYQESTEVMYVLGEWTPTDRMTPMAEAKGLKANLLDVWGLSPFHVEHFRGDSNSAGRRGVAVTCNQLMERSMSELVNSSTPVFKCRPPWKGAGSVRARARILSNACLEGKLLVHQDCTRVIGSLRHWMGNNDKYKHPFDALAYISDCYVGLGVSSGDNMQFTIVR